VKKTLTYISFGGGVQSTALLVMSALGTHGIPKADAAVFADTQAEIAATYTHLEFMQEWSKKRGIPLYVTTAGSLEHDVLVGVGKSQVSIPAFIKNGNGTRGIQRRQCTYDYKLVPIIRRVRELCGLKKGWRAKGVLNVKAMLGISFEEAHRMKPSREEWIENTFPLVDAKITREDCKRIIMEAGLLVPPRSSCYFCPYHRDDYWRWLKKENPVDFQKAIVFDQKIRRSQPNLIGESYLHDSLKPLSEINFDAKEQADGFGNECEGVCGV